jgi:(S)-sulfolactate dehydrogenase
VYWNSRVLVPSAEKVADYSLKNGLNVLAYDPYIKKLDDNEKNYKLSSIERYI